MPDSSPSDHSTHAAEHVPGCDGCDLRRLREERDHYRERLHLVRANIVRMRSCVRDAVESLSDHADDVATNEHAALLRLRDALEGK